MVCFCFDDALLKLFVFGVPLFMKHVVETTAVGYLWVYLALPATVVVEFKAK